MNELEEMMTKSTDMLFYDDEYNFLGYLMIPTWIIDGLLRDLSRRSF